MENAVKALTMAGSVLIALVIIGAILLVFNNLNSYQKVNDQLKKDEKVLEFNNQFETYNRTDVRGSDLLSLINRVIDYNERQSYVGKEGQDLGYKPIILTIDLSKNMDNIRPRDKSHKPIFEETSYTISGTVNTMQGILSEIKGTEGAEKSYTQTELSELVASAESIFLGNYNANDDTQDKAVEKYNSIVRKDKQIIDYRSIAPGSDIREKIYNYYEYIQFKRSYFDCVSDEASKNSGVEYDTNGRIIKMTFYANGKLE